MKLEELPLKDELKEGLFKYSRDNNLSPLFLLESLIEDFLIKKEYLIICDFDVPVEFPTKRHLMYTQVRANGNLQIARYVNGVKRTYGTCSYAKAKTIIEFLESKNWDLKYSTYKTKLKSKKQIDFLFNEMEKEGFL